MSNIIEADYVVVGAGAMGMAFVDEILTNTEATVVMVDQHAKPGGHWNDAYPYVRLHQPSSFYGVTSVRLGTDRIDEVGTNVGLSELASGPEVCAYYDQLMQRTFLPSGRVEYLPRARYADGQATFLTSGETVQLSARRAVVDATYMKVKVPSVVAPVYEIDDDARVVPPNQLPNVEQPAGGYNVIGAGKTAFDAIIWLLTNHVDPSAIHWVLPRDQWLLNRAYIQPGDGFKIGDQLRIIAESESAADIFTTMEAEGHFFRIDPNIEPTMYRCATVTDIELELLRKIDRVARGARVARVSATALHLDDGREIAMAPETLHVDCTADGLEKLPAVPVFDGDRITLQTVRACQQVFSAGLIGRLEAVEGLDEAAKNELATVIPHPDTPHDFLVNSLAHVHSAGSWAANPDLAAWILESRLSPTGRSAPDLGMAITAVGKLEAYLADA